MLLIHFFNESVVYVFETRITREASLGGESYETTWTLNIEKYYRILISSISSSISFIH